MNRIIAVFGPSGCGKTTVSKGLEELGIPMLVSHTTRSPRKGEVEGYDYYYVDRDSFNKLDLVERVSYSGNLYGLSVQEAEQKLRDYPLSSVVVDIHGVQQLKDRYGDRVITVYIMLDIKDACERMLLRGDSPERVEERRLYALETGEYENWRGADWILRNNRPIGVTMNQIAHILKMYSPGLCNVA